MSNHKLGLLLNFGATNSDCVAINIPLGQWHTVEVLESGTIIMEAKDGAYRPLDEDEIWNEDKD